MTAMRLHAPAAATPPQSDVWPSRRLAGRVNHSNAAEGRLWPLAAIRDLKAGKKCNRSGGSARVGRRNVAATLRMEVVMKSTPVTSGRRRPGEAWDLWRVSGRDRRTGEDRTVGYLVTDRERQPKPVAFVFGDGPKSLGLAIDIRDDHSRASEARDLRPMPGRRFWPRLLGMLLRPVDRCGRVITNDQVFAAGMYCRDSLNGRRRIGFHLFTHHGLNAINEKRDTPDQPVTPKLASRTGEEAGLQTAA